MSTESKEYEMLVKDLLQARLESSVSSVSLEVLHNQLYPGKSGHNHQIDVSAKMNVAGIQILILVECKFYSHRVGVDEVMELVVRMQDIGAQKGVLVTTIGFQDGAIKVARSYGIALIQAVGADWDGILCCLLPMSWTEQRKWAQERAKALQDSANRFYQGMYGDHIIVSEAIVAKRCKILGIPLPRYDEHLSIILEPLILRQNTNSTGFMPPRHTVDSNYFTISHGYANKSYSQEQSSSVLLDIAESCSGENAPNSNLSKFSPSATLCYLVPSLESMSALIDKNVLFNLLILDHPGVEKIKRTPFWRRPRSSK